MRSILIVSPDESRSPELRRLLEENGFEVTLSHDASEAMIRLRRERFDLVLNGPGNSQPSALELCRKVKQLETGDGPLFIFFTSLEDPSDILQGLAAGADNYILEPWEAEPLLERVRSTLGGDERAPAGQLGLPGQEVDPRRMVGYLASAIQDAIRVNRQLQRSQAQLERSFKTLNGLYSMATTLNQYYSEEEVASHALQHALELPGIEAGWFVLRKETGGFRVVASRELPPALEAPGAFDGECQCQRRLEGELKDAADIISCERLDRNQGQTKGLSHHASVPIWSGNRTLGLMNLLGSNEELFQEGELKTLYGVGNQVGVALERARLHQELETRVAERTAALTAEIAEREQAEKALRSSEARNRALLGAIPDMMIRLSADGRILELKPPKDFVPALGSRGIVGKSLSEILPPEVAEGAMDHLQRAFRTGKTQLFEHRLTLDGEVRDFEARFVPSAEGEAVSIVRDISERKRAEVALRESEAQLRQSQKMEAIGRLAGGVAHDFNNILTAINGYSDLLLADLNERSELRSDLEEIKRSGERAAALTRQLLAFSRRQVLQPEILDLRQVVTDIAKLLRRLIGEDVELKTRLARDLGRVRADPGQIEQILMNLAVNARDAMPTGGILSIETANVDLDSSYDRGEFAVKAGKYVMLAISDTGSGMDRETLSRIFEPFFTTKEAGKGTGLGLSTVYGMVKQSGGYIWVYSEPGIGTTFKIYFPRTEEEVRDEEAPPRRRHSRRRTGTILLVEDDDAVRALSRRILESAGYRILEACDGAAGVRMFKDYREDIDLILTDLIMPELSGMAMAGHLGDLLPSVPILFMSGYMENPIVERLVASGKPLLQKPFSADSLLQAVGRLLEGSRSDARSRS